MSALDGIRVARVGAGPEPRLESDAYVPLLIRWVEPGVGLGLPPVYLRVSGIAGGEFEFRIDRESGQLRVVTVILLGAVATEPPPPYPSVDAEEGPAVFMEPTLWRIPMGPPTRVDLLVRPYRIARGLRLDISRVETARMVRCGPLVTLGLAADGTIASLQAIVDIDTDHFKS
jgi:hypothetical protein